MKERWKVGTEVIHLNIQILVPTQTYTEVFLGETRTAVEMKKNEFQSQLLV